MLPLFTPWGQFKPPPPIIFFAITQKVFELGCLNVLTFLTNTCPSLKAKSWTFIPAAWVLRHTVKMACMFYWYQTKSLFRPTTCQWILIFYSSLKSLYQKPSRLHNFCKENLHRRLKWEFANFQFFLNTHLDFKFCKFFCTFKFAGSSAFQKYIFCGNLCIFFGD